MSWGYVLVNSSEADANVSQNKRKKQRLMILEKWHRLFKQPNSMQIHVAIKLDFSNAKHIICLLLPCVQVISVVFKYFKSETPFYFIVYLVNCNINKKWGGSLHGLIAKVLDFSLERSEFELQLRYYVYFRSNTLAKVNYLIPLRLSVK